MTEKEKQFNQWFDEYADGVKVFEEADMKQAYLQGRVELEKENKVLAQNLEDTEILNKTYEKRFSDLEKENAELKTQLEMSNKVYNDNLDYSHHIEGQLTTAKEIISEYINILKGDTKNWKKTQEKAELFLKGE